MQHAQALEGQRVELVGPRAAAPAQAVGEETGIHRQRAVEGVIQRAVFRGFEIGADLHREQPVVVRVLARVAAGQHEGVFDTCVDPAAAGAHVQAHAHAQAQVVLAEQGLGGPGAVGSIGRHRFGIQAMPGRVHGGQVEPAVVAGKLWHTGLADPGSVATGRVAAAQAEQVAGVLQGGVEGQVIGVDGAAEAVVGGDRLVALAAIDQPVVAVVDQGQVAQLKLATGAEFEAVVEDVVLALYLERPDGIGGVGGVLVEGAVGQGDRRGQVAFDAQLRGKAPRTVFVLRALAGL